MQWQGSRSRPRSGDACSTAGEDRTPARSDDLNEGVVVVSLLANSVAISLSGQRAAARPNIPQDATKFAEAALAESKREGLLLAVRARWVALALIAVTLPIINPNWDVIYYILMLSLFAAIGWAQLKVGSAGRSWRELVLMFCDLALLTFMSVVPNQWSTVDWPIAMQFRFDSFIYFFVLLATATLAYSWRTVIAMGIWTSALWVIGVGWAYFQPATHVALSESIRAAVGSDLRLFTIIDPTAISLGGTSPGNHRFPDRCLHPGVGGSPLEPALDQPRRHRTRANQSGTIFFAERGGGVVRKRRASQAGSNPERRGPVRRHRRFYPLRRGAKPDRGDRYAPNNSTSAWKARCSGTRGRWTSISVTD